MGFLIGLIRFGVAAVSLGSAALAILALFGFAVPYFDLLNHLQPVLAAGAVAGLLGILIFFRRGRAKARLTLAAVVGLAASLYVLVPEAVSGLAERAPAPEGRQTVRIMTHNVFGLNYDAARVMRSIEAADPDIIAFQEFFPDQAGALTPLLKPGYPYFVRCKGGKRANLGLFSRLPFKTDAEQDCPEQSQMGQRTAHIVVDFALPDGRSFSVLTTHLDWPLPLQRQIDQYKELAETVTSIEGPLAVMGDFNSTPWSYALRRFGDETGMTRQTLNLWTYPMRFWIKGWRDTLPILPLDQVFTRGLSVHRLEGGEPTGSDHLPVVFEMTVD